MWRPITMQTCELIICVYRIQQPDSISLTAAISASDKADQWETTIELHDRLQALLISSATSSVSSSTSTITAASLASTSLRAVTCALNACAKVLIDCLVTSCNRVTCVRSSTAV
jgi:hypothetical protein